MDAKNRPRNGRPVSFRDGLPLNALLLEFLRSFPDPATDPQFAEEAMADILERAQRKLAAGECVEDIELGGEDGGPG
jgi:hypothetical protein